MRVPALLQDPADAPARPASGSDQIAWMAENSRRMAGSRFVLARGCRPPASFRQIRRRRPCQSQQDWRTAGRRRSLRQGYSRCRLPEIPDAESQPEWLAPAPATTSAADTGPDTAVRTRSAFECLPIVGEC